MAESNRGKKGWNLEIQKQIEQSGKVLHVASPLSLAAFFIQVDGNMSIEQLEQEIHDMEAELRELSSLIKFFSFFFIQTFSCFFTFAFFTPLC